MLLVGGLGPGFETQLHGNLVRLAIKRLVIAVKDAVDRVAAIPVGLSPLGDRDAALLKGLFDLLRGQNFRGCHGGGGSLSC